MYGPKYLFWELQKPTSKHSSTWVVFLGLGWEWEEEWNMRAMFWLFRGLPKGLVSVSLDLRYWWGAKILGIPLSTTYFVILLGEVASVQFSRSVMSDSATPWTAAHRASLSITNSQSLLKLMFIELVMPSKPSHPLSSPSLPTCNLSQHQGLFQWVSSSHQVAKVLEFQLQH